MEKPTPAALAAFEQAFPADTRAERRTMFGMPAGFVNGNMFMGVFEGGVVLRLPPEQRGDLAGQPGMAAFEPMEGRPWRDYVQAEGSRWGGTPELARWCATALEHTATALPPKVPKARAPKR